MKRVVIIAPNQSSMKWFFDKALEKFKKLEGSLHKHTSSPYFRITLVDGTTFMFISRQNVMRGLCGYSIDKFVIDHSTRLSEEDSWVIKQISMARKEASEILYTRIEDYIDGLFKNTGCV